MATTPITSQVAPGSVDYTGETLTSDAVLSGANDNSFVSTGQELVILYNDTAGAIVVTFTSVADARLGREKSMVVSVPADAAGVNGKAVAGPFAIDGWRDTSGNIIMQAASAGVQASIIEIPRV